jgi:hypothetical protein
MRAMKLSQVSAPSGVLRQLWLGLQWQTAMAARLRRAGAGSLCRPGPHVSPPNSCPKSRPPGKRGPSLPGFLRFSLAYSARARGVELVREGVDDAHPY